MRPSLLLKMEVLSPPGQQLNVTIHEEAQVKVGYKTHVGKKREINQDSLLVDEVLEGHFFDCQDFHTIVVEGFLLYIRQRLPTLGSGIKRIHWASSVWIV